MLEEIKQELILIAARLRVRNITANFSLNDEDCQLVDVDFRIWIKEKEYRIQKLFDQYVKFTGMYPPKHGLNIFMNDLWNEIEELLKDQLVITKKTLLLCNEP